MPSHSDDEWTPEPQTPLRRSSRREASRRKFAQTFLTEFRRREAQAFKLEDIAIVPPPPTPRKRLKLEPADPSALLSLPLRLPPPPAHFGLPTPDFWETSKKRKRKRAVKKEANPDLRLPDTKLLDLQELPPPKIRMRPPSPRKFKADIDAPARNPVRRASYSRWTLKKQKHYTVSTTCIEQLLPLLCVNVWFRGFMQHHA